MDLQVVEEFVVVGQVLEATESAPRDTDGVPSWLLAVVFDEVDRAYQHRLDTVVFARREPRYGERVELRVYRTPKTWLVKLVDAIVTDRDGQPLSEMPPSLEERGLRLARL